MNRDNLQRRLDLKQKKAVAGLLSDRFPQVSKIEIRMTYYQQTMYSDFVVLMDRNLNISGESPAYFHMQCMRKECSGGFDLAPMVLRLIKGRKTRCEGKMVCPGNGRDIPEGHASISYEIIIRYN